MGKKASDELCRQNYYRLRTLFDSAVEDHSRFKMVYACSVDASLGYEWYGRVTVRKYANYAIGFDEIANEIVIVPVEVDMSDYGQPLYLKNSDIKSAKQSFVTKAITIKDKRLPRKYIQLYVQECLNEDPDNVCILIKQDEEAKQFQQFFKEYYSK